MKWKESVVIFIVAGIIAVVGNTIGYKLPWDTALIGYIILVSITLLGMALAEFLPIKLPMVFWISLIALLSTSPISPIDKFVLNYTGKMEFMAIATPILAYAGLAVGKDLPMVKQMSWRIVVVALAVYTGTFVFAVFIAEAVLRAQGII
ncbi:MAG TPA: hypothetical protein VN611_00205 [Patescibacteria group bacterium]|nr:hypothetical protein [Patescibacteria group bacterium]